MADGKLRLPYVNFTMLSGRLTRDSELHEDLKARPFLVFDMACSRKWKDRDGNQQEDVLFKRVTVYRGANWLASELKRGRSVLIEGQERTDTLVIRGKETKKNVLYATNVQLLDWQSGYAPPDEPAPRQPVDDSPTDNDDDLPF